MTDDDHMTDGDRAELVDVTAQLAGAQKYLKHAQYAAHYDQSVVDRTIATRDDLERQRKAILDKYPGTLGQT